MKALNYANWFRKTIAKAGVQPIYIKPGVIYAFAYKPKERRFSDLDKVPVFVPIMMRKDGMRGLNLLGLRDAPLRNAVIDAYIKAKSENSQPGLAEVLFMAKKIADKDLRSAEANKMFTWTGIMSSVVELSVDDLKELKGVLI